MVGGNMDSIDVHDLPEDDSQRVAEFVQFLRQRRQEQRGQEAEVEEEDWAFGATLSFAADWNNPEDASTDNWREHYNVPER